jgi:thymidylate synthase
MTIKWDDIPIINPIDCVGFSDAPLPMCKSYSEMITEEDIQEEIKEKTVHLLGGVKLFNKYINVADAIVIEQATRGIPNTDDETFPNIPMTYELVAFGISSRNCRILMYEKNESISNNEHTYLAMLRHIIHKGKPRPDRTGVGTISTFGHQMRFDISHFVPLLTTKFVPWKACLKELIWFLKGQTDATILQKQGVHIWDGNSSRKFLDKNGLQHLPEGDIGKGYGFQWRHFGAEYDTCKDDYTGKGFDQIKYIIDILRNDPYSRRIFMSAWDPSSLSDMALPPCHATVQFYVEPPSTDNEKPKLSCHMYQRSCDAFLGSPFNIFSYTALTYVLAAICGMTPDTLVISMGDLHIYNNHIEQVEKQLLNTPMPQPVLMLNKSIISKDIDDITLDDFEMIGYFHHPAIKAKMAV